MGPSIDFDLTPCLHRLSHTDAEDLDAHQTNHSLPGINGRVVKGVNFISLADAGDPVEIAERYEEAGADELVFLDITASHEERDIILDVVSRTAEVCFMPVTVGGGIRDLDDIRALLNAGADKVSINSTACRESQVCAGGGSSFRKPVHRCQY